MLTIYRRHRKSCEHRAKGRKHRHCQCPIWVDGFLSGQEIRESLKVRDWQQAQEGVSQWEIEDRRTQHQQMRVLIVFQDAPDAARRLGGAHEPTRRMVSGHRSQSEAVWVYAKRALARDDNPDEVMRRIANYRAEDKADPDYYAVGKAQSQLAAQNTSIRHPALRYGTLNHR